MATPQGTDWGPSLQCRAGVHARREALRRPGRVLARPRCGTPPPSLTRCHLPLQGRLLGRQPIDSLPCKGLRSRAPPAAEKARRSRCSGRRAQACFSARRAMRVPQTGRWLRRKAQTEGCIAALRPKYPTRPGRALPCPRRGRCSHRPGNPAVAQGPQAAGDFARPTLRPRAGSNAQTPAIRQARRGGWCQPRRILARQGAAPLRRLGRHYRFAVPALRCVC